jgi:hypothetical protein
MKHSKLIATVSSGTTLLLLSQGIFAEPNAKEDPLLNVLIRKGILTEAEAEQVRSEANSSHDHSTPAAEMSKWKISSAIKSIELFGDVRFRYEHREAAALSGDTLGRDRYRYAVRAGIKGDLTDHLYYGLRIETGQNPRSTWVTFADDSSTSPNLAAPSAKGSDGINIGQVYLGWRPADFTFQIGKMPNPLYTSSMVWDSDINPEGLSESVKHSFDKLELFATAGQFLYQDTNPDNPAPGIAGGAPNQADAFLLAFQVGVSYEFRERVSAKLAPAFYFYTGHGQTPAGANSAGFSDVFVGQGAPNGSNPYVAGGAGYINQTGINDLHVLEMPGEVNFPIGRLNGRVFGDFAFNFEGNERARKAAEQGRFSTEEGENKAYQIGFGIGKLGLASGHVAEKHAWEARAYWQHVEQYALDVNLLDSDFFEGRGNMEGVYGAVAYGLTSNIIGTLRYGYGDRINKNLGTGGTNPDLPQVNPVNKYQIFQADLAWKF